MYVFLVDDVMASTGLGISGAFVPMHPDPGRVHGAPLTFASTPDCGSYCNIDATMYTDGWVGSGIAPLKKLVCLTFRCQYTCCFAGDLCTRM